MYPKFIPLAVLVCNEMKFIVWNYCLTLGLGKLSVINLWLVFTGQPGKYFQIYSLTDMTGSRNIHWHVGLLWAPAGRQWEYRDWHYSLPQLTSEFRSSPCLGSSRLLAWKFENRNEEFLLSIKSRSPMTGGASVSIPATHHQQIAAHNKNNLNYCKM